MRVLFPTAGPPAAVLPGGDDAAPAEIGAVTVLVVDDEAVVRDVAGAMLGKAGATVLTAEDGRRGLEIFRARAGEIDCVVLDLTMPGLDGEEVFREITAIKPEMPVLLASGYTEEELAKRFADAPVAGFVGKPFDRETLVSSVARALKERVV